MNGQPALRRQSATIFSLSIVFLKAAPPRRGLPPRQLDKFREEARPLEGGTSET